jgi:hypothetical protein
MRKEYHYKDPREFERSPENEKMFPYKTIEEFEDLKESYAKFDRCHPIYYEERVVDDKVINAILDGGKYHQFSLDNNMEKVFACKLTFENEDDRIVLMAQLQRSCHDDYMALFHMIQALWPKHFKGQGYRSDITEKELEEGAIGVDGKRLNIYERIGKELFLTGNRVKHIRKIGLINSEHFERIEVSRFTLYQAYQECLKQEKGYLPEVPSVKAPVYYTTSTGTPVFSEPTTTADAEVVNDHDETANSHNPMGEKPATTPESEELFVTVISTCPHCGEEITLKINKNQIK